MVDEEPTRYFWELVILAAEADPRPARTLRGASGFEHSILALGVDEPRRRLICVSTGHDAPSVALAQADIQAANPTFQVIAVRPLAMDLAVISRILKTAVGRSQITFDDLRILFENINQGELGAAFRVFDHAFKAAPVNTLSQWLHAVHQLALVGVSTDPSPNAVNTGSAIRFDVDRLAGSDPFAGDRELGICPIPIYRFAPSEIDVFQTGTDVDSAKEILRKHGLLQFFLPPPDFLTLGLADHGQLSAEGLERSVEKVPGVGHPFAPTEIIHGATSISEVVAALQAQKLLVEGEFGVELSEAGKTVRAEVRFKPKESIFARILKRFSIDLSLGDFFRH